MRARFLAALTAVLAVSAGAQHGLPEADPAAPLGLGLAVVRVTDAPPPLRFYAHPALAEAPSGVLVESATVADSVTFDPGRGRASLGSGPPWLLPEVIDAARGHLAFRVRTLTPEWVEAVANRADGRTVWLRRDRVEVVAWPDVLLQSLVTLPDPGANPLRERPHGEASILATPDPEWQLRPLAVRGAWLQVSTLGLADRIPPAGWVRWTDGERLLVGGIGEE